MLQARDGLVRAHLRAARHAGRDRVTPRRSAERARSPRRRSRAHRLRARLVRLQRRASYGAARRVVRGATRASASASSAPPASGKTTIINLLLRFYDVQQRPDHVDGVDIRELRSRASCARLFGLVLQDVHLFSGTIARQHPARQRRRSTTTRCGARREPVHADAFIDALPAGYAAPVAERGATLSVGQKQLLSFARALAFDPRVLILDEATSSVDTETELLIRDALHVLMRGRTTIAIAHRLSTIQDMDQILVLHKGELRESGTHQELLARARHLLQAVSSCSTKDQERTSLVGESGSWAVGS